jgi:signal transduction histidine kinase
VSRHSIRVRTIAIGIVSAALGATVMGTIGRRASRGVVASGKGPPLTWAFDAAERARCEAAPAAYRLDGPGKIPVWAYDLAGTSANPSAPRLGATLGSALVDAPLVVDIHGMGYGGVVAIRVSEQGPCAILAAPWHGLYPRWKVWGAFFLSALVAALAGAWLSAVGVVRPLVRRLARVRVMAASVGAPGGYAAEEIGASDDLGQVASELDRAHQRIRRDAEQLEDQRRQLQDHIADVAHDLRTPIASLQLSLQRAAQARHDPALVQAIHDVVYVGGLISNLRLASELRDGRTKPVASRVALGEAVERAVLRLRFLAAQKGVALELSLPDEGDAIYVSGDSIAIEQALANVIENAVTHNAQEGHVAVLVQVEAAGFAVTVIDDGPGVELSELPRLGERTFRSDAARRRDARGSGLGLAITREVCERMGWTLAFAPELPTGLRVTIRGARVGAPQKA